MFGFINKTKDQSGSARGDVYKIFEGPKPKPDDGKRAALLESAKHFFSRKRAVGSVTAFTESLQPTVKPGWLLWAVSPAISQADHNNIVIQTRVHPQSPPWRV
jgi:hypothetical protein